jgi:hypothetical protein
MGNCGTREENAVVAAHAQGIHPSFPVCAWVFLAGETLVGGWISGCWGTSNWEHRNFVFAGLFPSSFLASLSLGWWWAHSHGGCGLPKNAFFLDFLLRCLLVYLYFRSADLVAKFDFSRGLAHIDVTERFKVKYQFSLQCFNSSRGDFVIVPFFSFPPGDEPSLRTMLLLICIYSRFIFFG